MSRGTLLWKSQAGMQLKQINAVKREISVYLYSLQGLVDGVRWRLYRYRF